MKQEFRAQEAAYLIDQYFQGMRATLDARHTGKINRDMAAKAIEEDVARIRELQPLAEQYDEEKAEKAKKILGEKEADQVDLSNVEDSTG